MPLPVSLETWSSQAIAAACLGLHVRRTARFVTRHYEDYLRPLDLKLGQFSILAALHRTEPISMNRLAKMLGMDRTTLTANLRPLKRRGLVAITPGEDDQRRHDITITDEGRTLLAQALPLWAEAQQHLIARLSIDVENFKTGLRELS